MEKYGKECCADIYGDYCPFMEKPCEEVTYEVCVALGKAYEEGYNEGYG